jgi:hypothetical protein
MVICKERCRPRASILLNKAMQRHGLPSLAMHGHASPNASRKRLNFLLTNGEHR